MWLTVCSADWLKVVVMDKRIVGPWNFQREITLFVRHYNVRRRGGRKSGCQVLKPRAQKGPEVLLEGIATRRCLSAGRHHLLLHVGTFQAQMWSPRWGWRNTKDVPRKEALVTVLFWFFGQNSLTCYRGHNSVFTSMDPSRVVEGLNGWII